MALSGFVGSNYTFTGTATNPVTVSHAMTSGTAGTNRVLIVLQARDSSVSMTYNGQAPTATLESGTYGIAIEMAYWEDAVLPTDTSAHDLVFTYGGNRTSVDVLVLEITGAKQSVTPNSTVDGGNEDPHVLTHVTTVDGVATLLFYLRGENRTMDAEPSYTATYYTTDAGTVNDAKRIARVVGPTPAGSTDYTWNPSSGSVWCGVAVDIEAAATSTILPMMVHHYYEG